MGKDNDQKLRKNGNQKGDIFEGDHRHRLCWYSRMAQNFGR
jgi:hypothetical protein